MVKSRLDGQVAAILFTEGGARCARVRFSSGWTLHPRKRSFANRARSWRAIAPSWRSCGRTATETLSFFHQGFISESGLGQTEADFRSAQATLKADQGSIDSARLQLEFTNVVAPVDGVAGAALLPIGGAAKAQDDSPPVVVNQVTPIHVAFALSRKRARTGQDGHCSRVRSKSSRLIPGASTSSTGRLEFLDNAVDASTGTIMARALFANFDRLLTPGQYAEVKITLGYRPGIFGRFRSPRSRAASTGLCLRRQVRLDGGDPCGEDR